MTPKQIEATKQKAEELARKQAEYEARKEARQTDFVQIIKKNDVYYLGDRSKYVMYDVDESWTFLDTDGLKTLFNIIDAEELAWFKEAMHAMDRVKLKAVNTFDAVSDNKLNTMSRDNWLKPMEGEVPDVFRVLMRSLGGGRQNVIDHLEQTLVYKYLHPETFKLPCITISGEGGVGKNEFIEGPVAIIFGAQQVAVLGTNEAFGPFNGQMLGKTVVYIDEAIPDKTDAESLKRKVGNKTLQVNVKFGLQGTFSNTPWYWLGGNGTNGNMLLAGDTTDRRYSVITVNRSLMHWVGEHIGHYTEGRGDPLPGTHPAVKWWNENSELLTKKENVAAWLYEIIEKWKHLKSPPSALHDTDYHEVREKQKSVFTVVMETIFDDVKFEYIEKTTLYRVYELMNKRDNSRGGLMAAKTFHADAVNWLRNNKPEIVEYKANIDKGGGVKTTGWIYTMKEGNVVRNNEYYVTYNKDRHCDELVEQTWYEREG